MISRSGSILKRDIWFERRFLFFYTPTSWQGVALLIVGILFTIGFAKGGEWLMKHGMSPLLSLTCYAMSFVVFISIWVIAIRHSGPKYKYGTKA